MNTRLRAFFIAIILTLLGVSGSFAQGSMEMEKNRMDMAGMMKSSHHHSMMAYKKQTLEFSKILRDMTKGENFEDIELAQNAFAEIKHSIAQTEEVHRLHSAKMSKEMMEKMVPMMEKMQKEKSAIKVYIDALEIAFAADSPDVKLVGKHSAELVMMLEKMSKPEKKMNMAAKKKM